VNKVPEKRWELQRIAALMAGIVAWVAVASVALLVVFNIGAKNQVLMFLPILAAVAVAWAIGEFVTSNVFN
jgi:hypothetical protein